MKHEEIPGFKDVRKDLKDARIMQVKATTEEERRKADELVKKLRTEMTKLIYNYQEEGKVK
ncbi:MAG: hypothetical protein II119_03925 [Bacilli bacterium]|nr:hypothetical protein [Bacilli bacterium]MBQ6282346.1 hypothetical protein [Bacilli bacterium]